MASDNVHVGVRAGLAALAVVAGLGLPWAAPDIVAAEEAGATSASSDMSSMQQEAAVQTASLAEGNGTAEDKTPDESGTEETSQPISQQTEDTSAIVDGGSPSSPSQPADDPAATRTRADVSVVPDAMEGATVGGGEQPSLFTTSTSEAGVTITGVSDTSVQDVVIPSEIDGAAVVEIGEGAFRNCASLTSVSLPDSIAVIGDSAFEGCVSLRDVALPNSLCSIGTSAFSGCQALESLSIPQSVTHIGDGAFDACDALTDLTYGSIVYAHYETRVGEQDVKGLAVKGLSDTAGNPTDVDIPSSIGGTNVVAIAAEAFSGCTSIVSVEVPRTVAVIGDRAFAGCTSISSLSIPDAVLSMGEDVFEGSGVGDAGSNDADGGLTADSVKEDTSGSSEKDAGATAMRAMALSVASSSLVDVASSSGAASQSTDTDIDYGGLAYHRSSAGMSWQLVGVAAGTDKNSLINVSIPSQIEGASVTSIGTGALSDLPALQTIDIPSSIKTINDLAFSNDTSLTSITIPSSVYTFGDTPFNGCSSLESITLLSTYRTRGRFSVFDGPRAGSNTLVGCDALKTIVYQGLSCTITSDGAVVSGVAADAVDGVDVKDLKTISIPESLGAQYPVVGIGANAFEGCSSLVSIDVPAHVTSIDASAFDGCDSLEYTPIASVASDDLVFASYGDGLIVTGYATGVDTSSISVLDIPSEVNGLPVVAIADNAFQGSSITTVTIPDTIRNIGRHAFFECSSLTSVTIPDSVKTMGAFAFAGCTSLKTVQIPGSLAEIPMSAFARCSSLADVAIPDGVVSIGAVAFDGCTALSSMTIQLPASVTEVGYAGFPSGTVVSVTNAAQRDSLLYSSVVRREVV